MKISLSQTEVDVLRALAFVIDTDEGVKFWHSSRTAAIASHIADKIRPDSSDALYVAGLLHDVGTLDIPNRRLHMDKHLEDRSVAEVRVHPQKGAAIIASLDGFIRIAKIVLDHHEWYDGSGYPRGLKADQISVESQILRIADKTAFMLDTNKDLDRELLIKGIKSRAGKEFSEDLYKALMDVLSEDRFWELIRDEKKLEALSEERFAKIAKRKEDDKLAVRNVIRFFSEVLDVKHPYTEGHSRRVAYYSRLIALTMGLTADEIDKIELAAYFHDIGKLGIPRSILDKKGSLTNEEFEIIKNHAEYSYRITKDMAVFEHLANIVGADQEHWDGSGYPAGLKKKEIPIEARIIFVADAFDAMTSNRSYRKAMPVSDALKELKRSSGTDFDPEVVNIACQILEGFENSSIVASYADPVSQEKKN